MKKKISILLSFLPLTIGGVVAGQKGELIFDDQSPKPHMSRSNHQNHSNGIHKHKVDNPEKNFIIELTKQYNTQDPYYLDEISANNFSEGKLSEAADALIAAATYGHNDSQAFLAEIDYESLSYIDSINPQSPTAIKYYKSTLHPKVVKHFISQSKEIDGSQDKIVELPGMAKKDEQFTFGDFGSLLIAK